MKAGARAGFTLIELLVSLVILALMLGAMGMIVVGTLETDRRLKATLLEERVGAAILELIARDVQACYAYGFSSAVRLLDSGSGDTLQILTTREPASSASDGGDDGAGEGGGVLSGIFGGDEAEGVRPPEPMRLTKVTYLVRESQSHPGFLALLRAEEPYAGELPVQIGPPGRLGASATGGPGRASGGGAGRSSGGGAVAAGPAVFDGRADLDRAKVFEVYAKVGGFEVQLLDADGNWRDSWRKPSAVPVAIRVAVDIAPDPRTVARREAAGREPVKRYEAVFALPVRLP